MAKVDYGAVALIPVGDYSASRQYHANELVGYQGSSYIALQNPPVGTLPTNTTYFMLHTEGTSIATASTPGTVKPDGTSTVVDGTGAMSVKPSILQTIQDTAESAAESASKIGNVPAGKTLQSQVDGLEPRVSSSEQALTVNLLNSKLGSKTVNGITVTKNSDITYILNGTATNDSYFNLNSTPFRTAKACKFKASGCPQGGSTQSYFIAVTLASNGTTIKRDIGDGAEASLEANTDYTLKIGIKSGTVCDNLTFKPMLTTNLSATYDDYVPYSGSSGKLDTDFKALSGKIGNVGNTDLQSQLNAATQSIAQNTTDIAANAAGISALNTGLTNISNTIQPIGSLRYGGLSTLNITQQQVSQWIDVDSTLALDTGIYVVSLYAYAPNIPTNTHAYISIFNDQSYPLFEKYCELKNGTNANKDVYTNLTIFLALQSPYTFHPIIQANAVMNNVKIELSAMRIK